MLGRSVALAERLCAICASVSPGERSPRLCLQKYNLSNASALISRRAIPQRPLDRLWHHDREAAGRRQGWQKYNGGSRQPEIGTRSRSLVDEQNYYQLYIGLWQDSKSRTNSCSRS
jgi:hypothetical protein